MKKVTAYIALGSNLGDMAATLLLALKMLSEVPAIAVRRVSQFIQTFPAGGPPGQPKYVNAAAELETTLSPQELLAAMQDIERTLGRDRQNQQRWGPRTCDLDILMIGGIVQSVEDLTIPHPRMHERLFVLRPLAQIAPDAVHPILGKTITTLLAELETQG